jgi:hypothetical protein
MINTREDFDKERIRLSKIIQDGNNAKIELDIIEHQYNYMIFDNFGVHTYFNNK